MMRRMRDLTPLTLADFDTAPVRFATTHAFPASPDAVFEELTDPSRWLPIVRRSVWYSSATGGVGAERQVDIVAYGTFRERMLVWEPGRRMTFTMTATTSPLVAQLGEDFILERDGDGTRLTWRVAARATALGRPLAPLLRATLRLNAVLGERGLRKRTASTIEHRTVA